MIPPFMKWRRPVSHSVKIRVEPSNQTNLPGSREPFEGPVMARAGCASMAIDAIQKRADESVADWRTSHKLTSYHAAHDLFVAESLATHVGKAGSHPGLARVVAAYVSRRPRISRARTLMAKAAP